MSTAPIAVKNQTIRYALAIAPVNVVPIRNTPTKAVKNIAAKTESVIVVASF